MIQQKAFPKDFKRSMVTKLLQPKGPSVLELSNKYKISKSVLYKWLRQHNSNISNNKKEPTIVPEVMPKKQEYNYNTAEGKLKAVIETAFLTEEEFGIYCREKGIYSTDLNEWKQQCLNSFESIPVVIKKEYRSKYLHLEKDYKKLKSELNRKEKALAEASALLVLQKKANLIWGEQEDEE
jgi:transposase